MRLWKPCMLLSVAVLSLGVSPARHSVLADPVHGSVCDYRCDYSTEGDPDENVSYKLPSNVSVPAGLNGTLNSMLRRSATFRHQCKTLDEAGNVRISLRVVVPNSRLYKARSVVERREDGFVVIQMLLSAPSDYIEAIGHEFEHAVEQAEGLDLKALASAGRWKVYEVDKGVYETERAVHAGHAVAKEYYSRKRY